MNRFKYIYLLGYTLLLLLSGCESEQDFHQSVSGDVMAVRFAVQNMEEEGVSDAESRINTLSGYRFEEGVLRNVFQDLQVDDKGMCHFKPGRVNGVVIFLANATEALKDKTLTPEQTTLDEFLQIEATCQAMTSEGILMTGSLELSPELKPQEAVVKLKRSVARLDLDSSFKDVIVYGIQIKGIVSNGYINVQEEGRVPAGAETYDYQQSYEDQPFSNKKETLFYLCEQGTTQHRVEAWVTINGRKQQLYTTLPLVKRNTIYTLKIYGDGADAQMEVLSEGWENGLDSSSDLAKKGWIDRAASTLPEGAGVNERGDTVFIPYWQNEAQLALMAEEGLEVRINGMVDGVSVKQNSSLKAVQQMKVAISTRRRMPGTVNEYVYLDLWKQNVLCGRVVIMFAPNPLFVNGRVIFDENGECDFESYVDGTLAEITFEEGTEVKLEFEDGEQQWAKLYQGEQSNMYYLEGGWKPNDPTANGREQRVNLVCINGTHTEKYVIKRRNWGLPVVNVNGTWWCKYNLRGNVKKFEDQILWDKEPKTDLADYLKSCTDEEFLTFLGDQYQAGNPDGLKLVYNGSNFHYEGFKTSSSVDFGSLAPTVMAPDGYEIPSYEDYRFFMKGDNNSYNYGKGTYGNGKGQQLSYEIVQRDANFVNHLYGAINFYDMSFNGTHLVFLGLGFQTDEHIKPNEKVKILVAVSGKPGKTWIFSGAANKATTWIAFANHQARSTRTIRCIKTPVKYIIEE